MFRKNDFEILKLIRFSWNLLIIRNKLKNENCLPLLLSVIHSLTKFNFAYLITFIFRYAKELLHLTV